MLKCFFDYHSTSGMLIERGYFLHGATDIDDYLGGETLF